CALPVCRDGGTLRGMTDSYNGFAFAIPAGQRIPVAKFGARSRRGIHVPGRPSGRTIDVRSRRSQRRMLVIATDVHRAIEVARSKVLAAVFVDAGPDILARARKIGIRDNDAGIDDGQAS